MIRIVLSLALLSVACYAMRPGGLTDNEKPADDKINGIVSSLASEIKSQAAATLVTGETPGQDPFGSAAPKALRYKSQVVAGTNYYVRTEIGKYLFDVKIFRPLPNQGEPSVTKVKGPVKDADPIVGF